MVVLWADGPVGIPPGVGGMEVLAVEGVVGLEGNAAVVGLTGREAKPLGPEGMPASGGGGGGGAEDIGGGGGRFAL